MKKRSLLIAILLVLLSGLFILVYNLFFYSDPAFQAFPPKSSSKFITYTNKENGYSVDIPENWEHTYIPNYGAGFPRDHWFLETPTRGGAGKFTGITFTIDTYISKYDLAQRDYDHARTSFSQLRKIQIADQEVEEVDVPVAFSLAPITRNDKSYLIFGSNNNYNNSYDDPILRKILSSFKLIN